MPSTDAGQRKIAAGLAAVIAAALAYIGFAMTGMFSFRLLFPPANQPAAEIAAPIRGLDLDDAYNLALVEARAWHGDAVLSSLSAPTDAAGRSDRWELVFISPSTKGRGYQVVVVENRIVSKEEISYQGAGADFPADLITPEEAVRQVRTIKGYEDAAIQGVEAVYGAGGKIWYWGVRTARGVVSIKARRQ